MVIFRNQLFMFDVLLWSANPNTLSEMFDASDLRPTGSERFAGSHLIIPDTILF